MQREIKSSLVTLRSLRTEFIGAYLDRFSPAVRAALHATSIETERVYLSARLTSSEQAKELGKAWAGAIRVNEKREGAKIVCDSTPKDSPFFYCIFDVQCNTLIGAIEIRDACEFAGQLYCWIHEDYWGTGYFQQALQLAAREYFARTSERFFTAHVDIDNMRSYHALRKAGFAPFGFYDGPYGKQHVLLLCRPVYACPGNHVRQASSGKPE